MGHDAEREQLKKAFSETFDKNLDRVIDKMSDAQVVVIYMRLKLQGKLKRK